MGLLRLLLALGVVTAHAGPPANIAWLAMTGGPPSVQVFYVISGFYMTLILNTKYVGPGSYATFAKSRLLRLVPMFLAVLAATLLAAFVLRAAFGVAIQPLASWQEHGASMPFGEAALLALTNLTIVGQDAVTWFAVDPSTHALYFTTHFHDEALPAWQFLFVPQAWTVSVEMLFYAVAPLLVRRRPWQIALVVAASLALRVLLMKRLGIYDDPWTYRFFPNELALFLSGALAWHAYRWLGERGLLRPWLCWLATAIALAGVLGFTVLPPLLQHWRYGLPGALAFVPVLLPFVFHATKTNAADRALGELSYPVYLVHYLLVYVFGALGVEALAPHRGIVVMVATLLAAIALWRGIGLPIESRRQRLMPRPAVAAIGEASRES
jgi:peptidoglycan/LPS O-acetylase OafA/YrhL